MLSLDDLLGGHLEVVASRLRWCAAQRAYLVGARGNARDGGAVTAARDGGAGTRRVGVGACDGRTSARMAVTARLYLRTKAWRSARLVRSLPVIAIDFSRATNGST